ncbi:MAG: hypothetical protein IKF95_05590, partial [Firmicutes bacterium]|nr:hypothetical protein [Bacillota bacterium]
MNNIDRIYSFVYLAIGFLFTELFFFQSYPFKERLELPIFCTAYMLATLSYSKLKNVRITKEAVFWMVITLVICFRVNFVNPFYAFLPRVVCAAYYTYSLGNSFTDGKGSSKYIIVDGICTMIFMPFASFLSIFRGIVTSLRRPKEKKDIARVIPALAGVLMAILALYMIIPQLIKADRNFFSGFGKILDDISAFFDRIFRKIYLPSRIMVSLP